MGYVNLGGGGGEATVAHLLARGETRKGIQFALTGGDAGADWGFQVAEREAGAIRSELDQVNRIARVYYASTDTLGVIEQALRSGGVQATLVHGTDPNALPEPHFQNARPFVAAEPYGQYTEVYVPATALFEHPVPATALFEAVDMGADGLTVTLGEPLEYGLDVNAWGITGHQRYQGTPDVAAQFPTLTFVDMPEDTGTWPYGGEFASGVAARAALTGQRSYYNTTDEIWGWVDVDAGSGGFITWRDFESYLGVRILHFPRRTDFAQIHQNGRFADEAAAQAYIRANINDVDFGEQYAFFDEDTDEAKLISAFAPAVAAAAASVDLPTSASGGVRVTQAAVGAAGNGRRINIEFSGAELALDIGAVGEVISINVPNGATAAQLHDMLAATVLLGVDFDTSYYGTEDGSTVLATGGSLVAGLTGTYTLAGGRDAVHYVPPVPGEPEEPIHIVLEPDARNQTMLDEEVFPTGQSDGPLPFIGTFPNQAAATAALGGLTSAVYFDTTRAMTDQSLPMLQTTNGGATWNTLLLFSVILDALGVYPIIDSAFPLFASATSTNIAHPDEATAAATAVAANLDPTRTYFYYNRATSELMRVRPGIFARAPVMEIYYNIAAGGRLTGPDTLGDIHDYINTHLEGLTSAYAGSGAADTDVTRPFANRSPFSGGSLNGLRVLIEPPLARGADGNNWIFNARARFAGGAEVTERQAHILIYTSTGRTGGIRITLDAGIQGLNEHGTPVDVSSGALGNEWTFATEAGTENTEAVIVSPTNREIIFRSNRLGLDETFASQLLNACNQGGTGCSATTFGGYGANNHVFRGRLGQINEESTGRNFHGGRDYHAATANPEPIAVTIGPTHAHTRLYTTVDGGILLSLIDPAHDGGNGFSFETVAGSPLAWAVVPTEERITLTLPSAGALASAILAAANAHEALSASYFGTETGTTNVLPARFGRHEMLGGLDEEEIEVTYAPVASGGIANPDTMGDVKAVLDAVDGLSSFYYGGAVAATTANRSTPWEHLFEGGETEEIDLISFGLGPEQNVFTGADRAAAEAARDTYAAANPGWVIAYRGRPDLWISLRWGNAGAQIGQTLRSTAQNPPIVGDWIDQALALRGGKGEKGDVGSAYADGTTILGTGGLTDRFRVATPFALADKIKLDSIVWTGAGVQALLDALLGTSWRTGGLTMADLDTRIAALVNMAPATLDTLGEIATFIQSEQTDQNALEASIMAMMGQIATLQQQVQALSGGGSDGVLNQATFNPQTYMAALGRTIGADVNLDLSAILTEVTSLAARITVLEGGGQMGDHTRYAASSPDANFSEAEWLAGNTSTMAAIVFPAVSTVHRRGFAIPATEASLTDIRVQGSPFNERASYAPAVGAADVLQDISGVSHKTYIRTADSAANNNLTAAERTFVLG